VGDAVVYEVLAPQQVRVHICRAGDFEPGGGGTYAWPGAAGLGSPGRHDRRRGGRQHGGGAGGRRRGAVAGALLPAAASQEGASPSMGCEYIVCNGSDSSQSYSESLLGKGHTMLAIPALRKVRGGPDLDDLIFSAYDSSQASSPLLSSPR